ncbi:MAG: trypsin-like serine protease [Myxococcales bacterium]|nr:trypsin-like serine protease [Myxococcales bacterium]
MLSTTSRISLGLSLVLALPGCSSSPAEPELRGSPAAIYYGGVETGEPWVVAVHYPRPGTGKIRLCTGSVIAPRAVLTAKHCVHDEVSNGVWQSLEPSVFTVAVATDVTSPSGVQHEVGVTEIRTTPGVYTKSDALGGDDIAVLILDAEIGAPVKPVSSLPAAVGDPLRIIGFGFTQDDQLGVKHSGDANVSSVATVIKSEGQSWTCSGDSGGPALHATRGEILGVTSFGPAACKVDDSYYTRLDVHVDLISQGIEAGGGGASGAAGAAGAAGGSACALSSDCPSDFECVAGACVEAGASPPDPPTASGASAGSSGGCSIGARSDGWALPVLMLLVLARLRRPRRVKAARGAPSTPWPRGRRRGASLPTCRR